MPIGIARDATDTAFRKLREVMDEQPEGCKCGLRLLEGRFGTSGKLIVNNDDGSHRSTHWVFIFQR